MLLPTFGQPKPIEVRPKKKEPKKYDPIAWNEACHKWHCKRWEECRSFKDSYRYNSDQWMRALAKVTYHRDASFYHWERLQALKAQQPE